MNKKELEQMMEEVSGGKKVVKLSKMAENNTMLHLNDFEIPDVCDRQEYNVRTGKSRDCGKDVEKIVVFEYEVGYLILCGECTDLFNRTQEGFKVQVVDFDEELARRVVENSRLMKPGLDGLEVE